MPRKKKDVTEEPNVVENNTVQVTKRESRPIGEGVTITKVTSEPEAFEDRYAGGPDGNEKDDD